MIIIIIYSKEKNVNSSYSDANMNIPYVCEFFRLSTIHEYIME